MEQPPNPLDNQDPLDDPLLDTLEHSIENPPGFVDPLFEHDEQFMDDLAQQLDKLEASIENTPLLSPESEAGAGGDELSVVADESTSESSSLVEGHESPETTDDQTSTPPDLQDPSANTPKPIQRPRRPPRRGGGSSRRKRGLLFKRRIPRLTGRTVPGRNWNIRFALKVVSALTRKSLNRVKNTAIGQKVQRKNPENVGTIGKQNHPQTNAMTKVLIMISDFDPSLTKRLRKNYHF